MEDKFVYKVEDVFHDIDGDPDNVNMTIPPEIMEKMGWKEGDVIRVENDKHGLVITKVEEK